MRIIVTGASGFLGRNISAYLNQLIGYSVYRVVRNLPVDGSGADNWIECNLTDVEDIKALLRRTKPDIIVNTAGSIGGDERGMIVANIGIPNLIGEMVARVSSATKIIHIGSAAEYGVPERGQPIGEENACVPSSSYGATKLAGTQSLLTAHYMKNIDVTILRLFNLIDVVNSASQVIGSFIEKVKEKYYLGHNGNITMGPLGAIRDFVSMAYLNEAIEAVIKAEASPPIINISSGKGVPVREVIHALNDLLPRPVSVEELGNGSQAGPTVPIVGNPERIQKLIGPPQQHIESLYPSIWRAAGLDILSE